MSFNFLAQKRIHKDIKQYYESDINKVGIYCHFDDKDITNVKALIIGPKDTPYENGFYFFDINFPNEYPFNPPKVKFLTWEQGIRFNPNLYTNGKVCLSILGTWSGPGWTTCLNLNTVLLSIQSLLNENPLQNEPGFDNDVGIKSINYAKIIRYHNIKTATIKMIQTTPLGFEEFKPIMEKHFLENIDSYKKYVSENKELHNQEIGSSVYSMRVKCNIELLDEQLNILYNKFKNLVEINKSNENISNSKISKDSKELIPILNNSKPKRKSPNEPAKLYDIGFKKQSENDEKTYIVVEVSGPKRTMKRWKLFKEK